MAHLVIIGGGPVATNAIETIRQFDGGESQITLISDEPAHSRMALPYWLSGQIPAAQTHTGDDEYFKKLNVEAKVGSSVTSINAGANSVTLSDGSEIQYDKLLIATGASPADLPIPGADLPGVQHLWRLSHTDALLKATEGLSKPRVVMIGAGFIGFIMLNAMFKRGWDLTVVEREAHVLPRMLDADAASHVESWMSSQGVSLHTGTSVTAIEANGDSKVVKLANGESLDADIVVVAIGIQPNTSVAEGAGIAIGEGIVVNDHMQTSVENIYAGGDVAQGPNLLGDPEIHSIQPTAVDHGRIAGANMAGQDIAYPGSLLMNILDCCGLQCASFGNWSDTSASNMTISSADSHVFRRLLWTDNRITGAIFIGRADDMGMLTDIGMLKGIIQTQTDLSNWKSYLDENPFDIRKVFVATNVASKLRESTLLGRPAQARQFRFENQEISTPKPASHAVFVNTKPS